MADHMIRFVQCPYCKKQFGVRYDQEVEFCFFCGGTINLEPTEYKEGFVSTLFGKIGSMVKGQIESTHQKRTQAAAPSSPFSEDFIDAIEEEDSLGFDKESIVPLKERLFKDRAEEPPEFDPLALVESDLLDEESVFPQSVPVPFDPVEILRDNPFEDEVSQKPKAGKSVTEVDPINRLRPAADDIPTYPRRPEEFEEEEPTYFTRKRVILFSIILGGILLILILMFIRDIMM